MSTVFDVSSVTVDQKQFAVPNNLQVAVDVQSVYAIQVNVPGPQGPRGESGSIGPAGPEGPAGPSASFVIIESTDTVPPAGTPAGTVVFRKRA